jgi:response regulator of citrate/malate metabolism
MRHGLWRYEMGYSAKIIKKILIVEDDSVIAAMNKFIVEALGYTVIDVVSTGEEAVKAAAKLKPDLIFMDIELAGKLTGVGAAKIIKEKLDVPIIYISGCSDAKMIKEAEQTQPYGFLIKPVSAKDIQHVLTSAFL